MRREAIGYDRGRTWCERILPRQLCRGSCAWKTAQFETVRRPVVDVALDAIARGGARGTS